MPFPRTDVGDPATVKDPLVGPGAGVVLATFRALPEDTHTDVAEDGTEHGAVTIDVKAPSTVFVLMTVDVTEDLLTVFSWENGVEVTGDVEAHDEGREIEEGAGILGGPVSIGGLEGREEAGSPLEGRGGLVVGDVLPLVDADRELLGEPAKGSNTQVWRPTKWLVE
ncbi:hypothetical protein MLD38_029165 [Melastoma candidum]|uniref:Uncharacterized protein n=1 Tax=Melastoma candidum TaxID=119954 RepID=A0ACB9N2W2_9MYRT|nr:hypothetical protein MLD38_029165 [Melastoma candidum]